MRIKESSINKQSNLASFKRDSAFFNSDELTGCMSLWHTLSYHFSEG